MRLKLKLGWLVPKTARTGVRMGGRTAPFAAYPNRLRFVMAICIAVLIAAVVTQSSKRKLVHGVTGVDPHEADVVIYGGTPAGIAAAVQVGRMGGRAVLIEPTRHLGGMMTSGLGFSDYLPAFKAVVGGISQEFFARVGHVYERPDSMTFEPHVAERVFNEMIRESSVHVAMGDKLDRVEVSGKKIVSVTTAGRATFRAQMFIDASYEGDLLAGAGVSRTIGREANAKYQETLNGVRPPQDGEPLSAFREPGRPASGLLPYVQADRDLPVGAADGGVQAYGYRLCLTRNAANRIPFTAPPGYDERDYELLARDIQQRLSRGETLELRSFLKIDALPNQKFDVNCSTSFTNGLLSTDLIGYNDGYIESSSEDREQFAAELRRYTAGLLYFLGHSSAVPPAIRREWLTYGLCRDEFQDNGNWPYQLYIREGRRMVSDYVMLEQNAKGQRIADRSIGLAAYFLDSHWVHRICKEGNVRLEGHFLERIPGPFPVAYTATVPKRSECQNLLVPVCLSASHVCFSAIRMEPTEMILGQSTAAAAVQAIEDGSIVQDVNYAKLAARLAKARQVLRWPLPAGLKW
ncbi:MAG TPA: FAD-dependent oxidoreductase [Chthoniobacterales bacterium]